ncbi:MAG: phenylalanine--tRNA ligase subunit beta [Campylobacterales bacterium]|nr:phenylalanine--tRNA ligase subunit beta [Campylobacterales bacterium]
MIFTRSWLSEFVDISKISDEDILKTLNTVGIEVAAYKKIEIPKNVVVGKIIEFEKHPNADKLSVCKVDSGKAVLDIVCGAKNVQKDALVALATIGAHLPGGIDIKQAELRGVQSYGMLCSSTELGLPKLNDGIMIFDHSIDKLKIGEELSKVAQIADSVFEVEITPNRGDCLSVRGIAREIAAFYALELKEIDTKKIKESEKGIGRILTLHSQAKTSANAAFRVFETADLTSKGAMLIDYRLAVIGENGCANQLQKLSTYVSHAVGINPSFIGESAFNKIDEKIAIYLDVTKDGIEEIKGKECVLQIGIKQAKDSEPKAEDANIILAATYISPSKLFELHDIIKEKDDEIFYRSSRGSEPDLTMGLNYTCSIMSSLCGVAFYAGCEDDIKPVGKAPIKVDINKINTIVGSSLDKNLIVSLLRKLYFGVTVNAEFDSCVVEIPPFRHDIVNVFDLSEEIVRIKGIDTIESVPMTFTESLKENESIKRYRFLKNIRQNAAAQGFFEAVHFIFADRATQEKFGFECIKEEGDIVNPITSELNTLRSTLLLNLLSSASKNAKNSQSKIALFEAGTVFNKNRDEKTVVSFVWAGASEDESITNAGKPSSMDLQKFVSKLSSVFGGFEFEVMKSSGAFLHPHQCAQVVKDGIQVGFVAKLHPSAEEFFELKNCFVCEINFSKLVNECKKAKEFSKFQRSVRDLTIAVSADFAYAPIRKCIEGVKNKLLKSAMPIDIYKESPSAKDASLTIRLVLQSDDRTLEDKDIQAVTTDVLNALNSELGLGLKQ